MATASAVRFFLLCVLVVGAFVRHGPLLPAVSDVCGCGLVAWPPSLCPFRVVDERLGGCRIGEPDVDGGVLSSLEHLLPSPVWRKYSHVTFVGDGDSSGPGFWWQCVLVVSLADDERKLS